MGRLYLEYLEGRVYSCKHCKSHLATCDELVSKSFHSRNGKAYLFNSVVNVSSGPKEERMMTTGRHEDYAQDKTQKYKEGKFILERSKMVDVYEGTTPYNMDPLLLESDCEDGIMT